MTTRTMKANNCLCASSRLRGAVVNASHLYPHANARVGCSNHPGGSFLPVALATHQLLGRSLSSAPCWPATLVWWPRPCEVASLICVSPTARAWRARRRPGRPESIQALCSQHTRIQLDLSRLFTATTVFDTSQAWYASSHLSVQSTRRLLWLTGLWSFPPHRTAPAQVAPITDRVSAQGQLRKMEQLAARLRRRSVHTLTLDPVRAVC